MPVEQVNQDVNDRLDVVSSGLATAPTDMHRREHNIAWEPFVILVLFMGAIHMCKLEGAAEVNQINLVQIAVQAR